MKKRLIFFFLFFVLVCSDAQNQHADSLISFVKTTSNVLKKSQALSDLSVEFRFTEPERALEYGQEALKFAREAGDSTEVSNSFNCIGIANHVQGKYTLALSSYLSALRIFDEMNNLGGIAATNLNLGILYADQGKPEVALTYYKNSLVMLEKVAENDKGKKVGKNQRNLAAALNNVGTMYSDLKKFPLALEYHQRALEIRKEMKDSSGIASSLMNIGIVYLGMEEIEKAIPYYVESIKMETDMGDLRNAALNKSNLGEVYYKMKDYKNAIKYQEECLEVANELDLKPQMKQAFLILSKAYAALGDYKKAWEYMDNYAVVKDSIFSSESLQSITEMQTKYDTEKKVTENNLLKQESEIKNLQLNKNRTFIIILALGLGLIALTAFILYTRYREKNKDNLILEQKNEEITHQKKEITDSINYAKKIQNAILPSLSLVKKLLPESFILYKPKDIVSGDFFWIEQKGDIVLFAAVDCTGHGVPGAMMSVLGFNLLTQAVKEKGLTSPAAILKHLDIGVNQSLRQTTEENAMKDGMDLSLCALNTKTLELDYAGAYNPLWIVKSTNELIEVKADKKAIGTNLEGAAGLYKNTNMQLQKGDCIYVFTDGFADQFGGTKGKKFMYKPMKELVVAGAGKPMQNQANILENTLYSWKSEYDQVDDILVIGVRV